MHRLACPILTPASPACWHACSSLVHARAGNCCDSPTAGDKQGVHAGSRAGAHASRAWVLHIAWGFRQSIHPSSFPRNICLIDLLTAKQGAWCRDASCYPLSSSSSMGCSQEGRRPLKPRRCPVLPASAGLATACCNAHPSLAVRGVCATGCCGQGLPALQPRTRSPAAGREL